MCQIILLKDVKSILSSHFWHHLNVTTYILSHCILGKYPAALTECKILSCMAIQAAENMDTAQFCSLLWRLKNASKHLNAALENVTLSHGLFASEPSQGCCLFNAHHPTTAWNSNSFQQICTSCQKEEQGHRLITTHGLSEQWSVVIRGVTLFFILSILMERETHFLFLTWNATVILLRLTFYFFWKALLSIWCHVGISLTHLRRC